MDQNALDLAFEFGAKRSLDALGERFSSPKRYTHRVVSDCGKLGHPRDHSFGRGR